MKSTKARFANAFTSMLKSRIITRKPFFLAHAITYACNSKCQTCTYWQMSSKQTDDLTTQEVYQLLDEAYDFGMRGYYLFGGEPLVRTDIEAVVKYAKEKGFLTTMNTNASLLAMKAHSLAKNLDFVFVSLDYYNDYHDTIRGRKGAFQEAIQGIQQIRQLGNTRATLVTTISKLNFDAIKPMAKFAQELGVGISYNAVEPTVQVDFETGRTFTPVKDYGLTKHELQQFYDTLLQLKQDGYPLMETKYVLKHYAEGRGYTCHFPKIFVYVSPDKKIFNCTYDHTYDLKTGSFTNYFNSPLFQKHVETAKTCNICVRTCVRMYSYAYALKPLNFLNLYDDIRILVSNKSDNYTL